jgi:hypothetical protein
MPPVAGAIPASAAYASGSFAMTPYAAVRAAVMIAAGTIIPATATITPRQPAMRCPSRPASATRWMPGLSWHRAHASVNSRSLMRRVRSTRKRRRRKSVLVPPPTDCVPTATKILASSRIAA